MRMAPKSQGQAPNSPFHPSGGIMPGQPQGLVQPSPMRPHPDPSCQFPGHFAQQQMQMQMQMQMQSQLQLQAHMQMQMQVHEGNCYPQLAAIGLPNQALQQLPVTGTSTGSGGDSQCQQIKSDLVQNAHMVSSSHHMHSRAQVEVPNANMVSSAMPVWNPTLVPAMNVPSVSVSTPISNPTPGLVQLPHLGAPLQPNPLPMLNNNMHITAQQSAVVQQLASVVANIHNPTTLMHILSFVQCFQNGFPGASMSSPINNYQSMPPQGSTPGLASHTNPQVGPTPQTPPYPPAGNLLLPMQKASEPNAVFSNTQPSHTQLHNNVGAVGVSQNQSQIPYQQLPPHPPHPPPISEQKHLTSQALSSDACPPFSSNPAFPTPTQPTAQTFNPPFVVQNVGEMSQMAAAHLAGNTVFQGGGPVPMHQNHQQLQQIQNYMYPNNLQPSQASSNEQEVGVKNSPTTNDMQHHQNVSFRGISSGIGGRDQVPGSGVHQYNYGGRVSTDHGRWPEAVKPYPKRKIGSSGLNSSEQAQGRTKHGFPLPNFSQNGKFNNGPSRFQKNVEGARSYADALICKNCEISFSHRRQLDEHLKSHVKCDELDCSFDASGKMLKEHMLIHHKKQSGQALIAGQRAASLKSKESAEEIQQWREERKRNYPTESTITRKAQEMQQKRARGELIDEDAKKRRQRLREILTKQAELGIQVAEVPDHYMHDSLDHQKGHHKSGHRGHFHQDSLTSRNVPNNYNFQKSKKSQSRESGKSNEVGTDDEAMKIPRLEDLTSPRSVLNDASDFKVKQSRESIEIVSPASGIQCPESSPLPPGADKSDKEALGIAPQNDITDVDMQLQHSDGKMFHKVQSICRYFQKGFCKKGQRCDHVHVRMSNDGHNQTSLASKHSKREPTLLEKLLSREIKREKSHLLQVFRFMVNNSFFSEWPNKPLKFFQWSGEASNVNPEQAERQNLSFLDSITGIDEVHTEFDEDDAPEKIVVDETESSSHEDIEEGEIVEGEVE